MFALNGFQLCGRPRIESLIRGCLLIGLVIVQSPSSVGAQESPGGEGGAAEARPQPNGAPEAIAYAPAIDLLPASVAGLVRVPNVPRFCEAWKQTYIGKLLEHPSMQPFLEAQRELAVDYLESIGNKVGVRLEDIYEIASGEAVFAWLPFPNDERRPFALCVIADIRGRQAKAEKVLALLETDLKAGGWERSDLEHQGQTVRVYTTKPKPGQLKVEQIAITLSDSRIIASDRDSVVTDLLDAIAQAPAGQSISETEAFKTVLTRSAVAIREAVETGGGTAGIEWFAKPFAMGRIIRESLDVDRGTNVDILQLLENQGFDAIEAAGGIVLMAGETFDVLHKGYVWAPPVPGGETKYALGARMLQFYNAPVNEIPAWVPAETAALNRVNLRIEEAFWAAETLVDEAFGDEIFREIIVGIREDEDGPQIDLENNVLPNLDDRILLLTDNVMPADIESERLLVAIRVADAEAIKTAVRKAMEVEPDASRMDVLPGVEIWRVQRGEGTEEFDAELFGDFPIADEDIDQAPPLLEHWAIALVEQGPGSTAPYLMFSSHPDLLVLAATRIQQGAAPGFAAVPEVQTVIRRMQELGGQQVAFNRIVRTELSLRVKYELLRQGKLKESDTILATLYRRLIENQEAMEPDAINAAKLPPLKEIEAFLPEGGSFFSETADGWELTGFYLKTDDLP